MAFNMKGSSLYGKLNLNRGGNENRPDGRAKSSAFQKDGAPMKDSPAKDRITVKRPVGTATEKGGQKYDWVDDGHVHPHDKATKRNRAERERGKTVKKGAPMKASPAKGKMWDALKKDDYATASLEMLDSNWYKQTPKRCESLAKVMKESY